MARLKILEMLVLAIAAVMVVKYLASIIQYLFPFAMLFGIVFLVFGGMYHRRRRW